jgi:flagellar biosynthesis anti-sigma factor FlgM
MRVDLTTFGLEPPEKSKTGRAQQTEAAATGAAGIGATTTPALDQANFSFDRTRVQSLAAQVLAQPEIRLAKVQPLQQAIGNGEYSVPPGLVANAIVSELAGAQG